jgi:hypothetical protein
MTASSSHVRSALKWALVAAVFLHGCAKGSDDQPGGDRPGAPGVNGSSGAGAGDPNQPGADGPNAVPDDVGITKTDPCFTAEQSFAWELYGGVFSRCIGCHNDFGLARQVGVSLRLTFPGEPDFAAKNVTVLKSYAPVTVDVDGAKMPILLAKPTARTSHMGGEVIPPDGPEAQLLESFVAKLVDAPSCKETPPDNAVLALQGLTLASPRETLARAKFLLTGQVATPEEIDALPDTEAMLDEQLDALMETDAFLDRAQEMFGDWLLTDAYSSLVRGDDLLNQVRDYPQTSFFQPLCTPERDFRCCDAAAGEACCINLAADTSVCTPEAEDISIDAVAREPLALVRHIVKNNLPMTELVTADYGMANPYSAVMYGLSDAQRATMFDTEVSNDASEWKPMLLSATPQNNLRIETGGYPHVGVLSMPTMLVRYPSSTSNQQRTRSARVILDRFLAIPVMKLSDFSTARLPPDADLELATQQYPACTVCHAAIDPIAGHFQNFGSTGQYRTSSRGRLAEHLPEPSFLGTPLAMGTGDPLRALGLQVAQHPRFGLGVLTPVLADLIGTEILTPPNDMLAEDYKARYLAFRIQQIEVQRLRREFAGPAGLRLKPLVKAIVKGAFFRAVAAPTDLDEITAKALAIAGVGVGALLTPEQMARKIESVTGLTYRSGLAPDGRDMFRSFREFRLMFGGTDWDATPNRYRDPNAMSVRIAMRAANQVACLAVPQDFAIIDPAARRLFPNVDLTTTPDGSGQTAIRQEISRLHRLLLGENLEEGHAELEATYQLFVAARQALTGGSQGGGGQRGGVQCEATTDFTVAETPYPTATHRVVDSDPNNTLRPWIAVVAYLMSDGRFFLQ